MMTRGCRSDIVNAIKKCGTVKKPKGALYYNAPCSFDIETTSFIELGEKRATMYIWQACFNGVSVYGRTWSEWFELNQWLIEDLGLNENKRIIIYVHNLSFEFQFLCHYYDWQKVFCMDSHKPIFCSSLNGFEFRCSYLLSGYGLAKLAENLHEHTIKKLVGDLDYKVIRNSSTPLTDEELAYCENDVKIVVAYIAEQIKHNGNSIVKIPYTKTGYVRRYCRQACYNEEKNHRVSTTHKFERYRALMRGLTLTPEEYVMLKRAFMGGFTHASAWKADRVHENVSSIDFTSSYPYQLISSNKFPMSRGERYKPKTMKDFEKQLQCYACLFDVEFEGLESRGSTEHYLSRSRCYLAEDWTEDNGRIVRAGRIRTTITEQDFTIIRYVYKWDHIRIGDFYRYRRGYLPTDLVKAILKLYQDKTVLKGVEGKEQEYLHSKEMLNSCYGMMVTDICRDEFTFKDGEWICNAADIESEIHKYNTSKNRFTFYPWGVWTTALARVAVWTGIAEFDKTQDYIYSDTDSIKCTNFGNHIDYFNRYNDYAKNAVETALKWHDIPVEYGKPKTIKGVEKPLGVWDFEGTSDYFKTLGAKRYLVYKNGHYELTVAGLNKKTAIGYMQANGEPFVQFNDDMYIPVGFTGKNVHYYGDYAISGELTDYLGHTEYYSELSFIHLGEADYSLKLSYQYADYIRGLHDEAEIL